MADLEQPLLGCKKVYPKCAGCKAALLSADGAPPPYANLSFVAVVVLCNALPISSLYPYLYFMVKDFKIANNDEDIGFYAGFLGSAFMFGRFLTSIQWGILADKYGRKPIMLASLSAILIFNTAFGASTSFWMALICRLLLGGFNGCIGPVKAYASEICSSEHQALGVSAVGTMWGLGLIIGPAIGGYFSQPAVKFPTVFPPGSLFDRFPYLLPALITSLFSVFGIFITMHLPETVHFHKEEDAVSEDDEGDQKLKVGEISCKDGAKVPNIEGQKAPSKLSQSLLRNWPLLSSIAVYCLWSMHEMAYTEIFSLWAVSPRSAGGLGFTTTDVGNVLSVSGAALLIFQLLLFPPVARRLGPINVTRAAAITGSLLLAAYPFIAKLRGPTLWVALLSITVTKNVLSTATMSGTFLLINNSTRPSQRGAANGLSVGIVSLFKAIGPGAGGAVFAWAQSRHSQFFPGNDIVFLILGLVGIIAFVWTFEPILPRSLDHVKQVEDEDS